MGIHTPPGAHKVLVLADAYASACKACDHEKYGTEGYSLAYAETTYLWDEMAKELGVQGNPVLPSIQAELEASA